MRSSKKIFDQMVKLPDSFALESDLTQGRRTMEWLFGLLAVLAGAAVVAQSGVNTELARFAVGPLNAATISFIVGALSLVLVQVITGNWRDMTVTVATAPWWAWIGGVLGVGFVLSLILVAPRIGAAGLFTCVLSGQLIMALCLDHFGKLGYGAVAASPMRMAGIALVALGAFLILKDRAG